MKHTPTPWTTDSTEMNDSDGHCLGYTSNHVNAEFIVKAVNNHEKLLEALKHARNDIASYPRSLGYDITSLPIIDEAIKAAEE